jgi:hypothetical protein
MQVFSKRKFDFGIPGARIGKGEFGYLPDATKKLKLFQLALEDGSIRLIEKEKAVEETPETPETPESDKKNKKNSGVGDAP